MSPEFIVGLVTGGFVLTMAWELWSERRAQVSRVRAVCAALLYELDENQDILSKNRLHLETEQVLLTSNS
jgi:hypothetical protein